MTVIFKSDFSQFSQDSLHYVERGVNLQRQPWWRRLLNLPRPEGVACVRLDFKFEDGEWHSAEAFVYYPEGVDRLAVRIETSQDGRPIYFNTPDILT